MNKRLSFMSLVCSLVIHGSSDQYILESLIERTHGQLQLQVLLSHPLSDIRDAKLSIRPASITFTSLVLKIG